MFKHPFFAYQSDDKGTGGELPATDTVVVTPPAQPAPVTPPSPPTENWEKRFKGLQPHVDRLQNELSQKSRELDTTVQDYEGKLSTATAELTTERSSRKTLETEKLQLQQANLALQKQIAVMQLIHDPSKPELGILAPLHAKGLISVGDLEGENLENFLKDYATTLGQQLSGQIRTAVGGAQPSAPSGTRAAAGQTADDLYDQLMSLSPSDPQYATLQQQYHEQIKREDRGGK